MPPVLSTHYIVWSIKQESQLSQSMCKRTFMEAEQLFSATPISSQQGGNRITPNYFISPLSESISTSWLIIWEGLKKIHSQYKNWVVLYYQHKVVINHLHPERNLMKFFIVFLWGKVKMYVSKPIITSKCSAYQHMLFQLRPNIKLYLWPVVANLLTFTQNNVWLPYTPAYTKYSFKCLKNLNSMIQILLL